MKIKKNLGKLFLSLFIFFFGFLLMDDITEPIEVVAASNVSGCCRYTGTNPGEAQPGVPVNSCTIGTQSSSTCPEMVNMGGSTLYYHWTFPGYCSNKTSYNPGGICVDGIEPIAVDTGPSIPFKLQIPIPGWTNQPKEYSNETLALYIVEIYKFFVGALGVVAVVMIMIGGFRWLISGGSSDKVTSAKEMISNAIVGLVLGLVSYLLLYTLNPATTSFKSLQIPSVSPLTMKGVGVSIRSIKNLEIHSSNNGTHLVSQDTYDALAKAANYLLEHNQPLIIISDRRTNSQQEALYKANCPNNSCNTPTCAPMPGTTNDFSGCPHVMGVAVDVTHFPDLPPFYKEAMKFAGFCQLNTEVWHFEKPQTSGGCVFNY